MDEMALAAGAASGARMGGGNLGMLIQPDVVGQQGAAKLVAGADEELEGLGGGDGGDKVDGRIQDAGGVAGLDQAAWGLGKDAGEAGGFTGENVESDGVAADGGGVNPGEIFADGVIVDEITSFEIVGAVEDELHVGEEVGDVAGHEVGDVGFDDDFRVEGADFAGRGDGLGQRFGGIGFVKEHLTLQVAGLDVVAIEEAEIADPGAGEERSQSGAGGAATDEGNACGSEALLALGGDGLEEYLAGIAFERRRLHIGCPSGAKFSARGAEKEGQGGGLKGGPARASSLSTHPSLL